MSTFATPSPSKISRYSRYGSWQVLAEAQFQRGIIADTAPVALPAGGLVDATDVLFDRPGKIRKRGGTAYSSPALGSANSMTHVSFVPFAAGVRLIGVAATYGSPSSQHVFDASFFTAADLGSTAGDVPQPPVFYNDHLYILTRGTAATPPSMISYNGTACTLAASVAVPGLVGCAHAGYLVIGNDGDTHQNRLWFSPIPDPETTWDTANAYIDTNGPITGLASVQGVLLVFHAGSSERILGSIPPGTVGENMSLQPLSGQAGCIDASSIRPLAGNLYFADLSGVWVTNGASVTSITSRSDGTGISILWRNSVAQATAHSAAVRAGTFGNDYYLVGVLENDGALWFNRLFLVYHVATGVWSRFVIAPFSDFAASVSTLETFAAPTHQGRVVLLSDLFADAPALSADADGTVVTPTVTSRVMGTGPFEKAFGDGHLTYDLRGDATLALTYSRDIEQQSFQSSATFPGVTVPTRQRFPVSGDGHGFTFRVAQTGASTKTELYAVELEHRNYEEQADG